jgi:hypothetical protein
MVAQRFSERICYDSCPLWLQTASLMHILSFSGTHTGIPGTDRLTGLQIAFWNGYG